MEKIGALAAAHLAAAATAYLVAFFRRRPRFHRVGGGLALAGFLMLTLEGAFHTFVLGHPPFMDFFSAVMALTYLACACVLWAHYRWRMPAVAAILMPCVAFGQIAARVIAPELQMELATQLPPGAGLRAFLFIHVGLIFLGYGAIFVSAAASVMYLLLDHELRLARSGFLFESAPPLSDSASVAARALTVGIALLGTGLALGIVPALLIEVARERVAHDIKIHASILAFLFFLGLRLLNRHLRTRHVSWLLIVGAAALVTLHLTLAAAPGLHRFVP
jgi:ABC-type uncharacterized transport system permease subunit